MGLRDKISCLLYGHYYQEAVVDDHEYGTLLIVCRCVYCGKREEFVVDEEKLRRKLDFKAMVAAANQRNVDRLQTEIKELKEKKRALAADYAKIKVDNDVMREEIRQYRQVIRYGVEDYVSKGAELNVEAE